MIVVAATGLDEDVEGASTFGLTLEGSLLAGVVQDELESLLVPELESREDLAEVTASLLEHLLYALEVGNGENGNVDGL